MNEVLLKLTANIASNDPLEEAEAQGILIGTGVTFPEDYIAFMLKHNGGEGPIGKGGFIRFWMLQELIAANEDYAVQDFAPGLFLIGSDGGDTAYGVRRRDMAFIEVPFIGMSDNEAKVLGANFMAFLQTLTNRS